MTILCPKCLKDDQVQKVSAIVSSGTFTTTYNVPAQGEIAGHKVYGTVQQTGMGKTELAKILSMPTDKDWNEWKQKQISQNEISKEYMSLHPAPRAELNGKEKNFGLRAGCIVLGACSFFTGASYVIDVISSSDTLDIWGLIIGVFFVLLLPLSLGVAKAIFEASNPKEYKEKSKEHKQKYAAWIKAKADYVNAQIANIQKTASDIQRQALSRFNMLYYCYRDDVIFLPETSFYVGSQEMKKISTWANLGELNFTPRRTKRAADGGDSARLKESSTRKKNPASKRSPRPPHRR